MHVVVGTRSTPDTAAKMEVTAAGGASWGESPLVINPWDEYAVEEALKLAKEHGGSVTVLAIGPDQDNDALKHAIAMGANEAVRAWEESWAGLDSLTYAALFAAAVNKLGDVDLVVFGKEFTDAATDQHVFQVARKLGWPVLSFITQISAVDFAAKTITVERLLEEGKQTLSASLPAVINVMKEINEPRYPSFMGIRKAAKADIPVWGAADLGVNVPAPKTKVSAYQGLPVRSGECEIIEGDVAEQAATLADRLMNKEKVV